MAIRSKEEFVDRVDKERAWRIKELSALKDSVSASGLSAPKKAALNKSCIAMLYAHWEGFVKKTGTYYLEYVSMQRLNVNEMRPCFVSLILKGKIDAASESKKYSAFESVAENLIANRETRMAVPYKNVVDTRSNLSSTVLREISQCLGLSYDFYEPKQNLIDKKLVDRRNHIAHGEEIALDSDDVLEMFTDVITLMDEFKNLVENSVVTAGYKLVQPAA